LNKKENRIKRILEFSGKSKGLLTLAQMLSGVSAVFILLPFLFVYFAAKELVQSAGGASLNSETLVKWGIASLITELIGLIIYFVSILLSHKAAFTTEKNIKMAVLKHLADMPMGYFDKNPSGKLRKIIDENTAQTESYLAHQMLDLVSTNVTLVLIFCMMIIFNWKIGLPLSALFIIGFMLQFVLMGKDTMQYMQKYQDASEQMNHEAVEYVRGISVVKVFGQSAQSLSKFNQAIESYSQNAMEFTMACRTGMVAFTAVINSPFLVLIPAALICGTNAATVAEFTQNFLFYVFLSPACSVTLNKIMYMNNYKMQAEESMRRIDEILLAEPQTAGSALISAENHDVVFSDVSFTYENASAPAVNHVSFTAETGKTTAIVGHSGSGKSTLASLILRFYDNSEGSITIGGTEIKSVQNQDLMKHIAFVFQNPKLFKDTLFANICASRKDATREEVLQAVHLAQCDDILAKFPQGLDTVIGTEGVYLSGGEVQRIAIARAILKDAPVIILDEATAYADPENEMQIQKAFQKLTNGKTVIMIAHRLSSVKHADKILVMDSGNLIQEGTHEELLHQKGSVYAEMWENYVQTTKWHIGNEVK